MTERPDMGDAMHEGWHLDKRVPITIIMTILAQTAVLLIWGAKLDSRVSAVEQATASHTVLIEAARNQSSQISVGMARIEERQIQTTETLKDIKARLDATSQRR